MSAPETDRVTGVAPITTHGADGVALIMRALRGSPRVLGLLAAFTAEVQAAEDALYALLADTLATAVGAQLDQLGRVLLEPRLTLTDANYRPVLQATVLARKSRGTAADLCAVLAAMLGGGAFTYGEGLGYVTLQPAGALPLDGGAAILPLRLAKAGGVRLELLDPPAASKVFTLAPGYAVVNDALGLGDGLGNGGQLAGVRV